MKIAKKYESGAATNYISRRAAIRKLQLSLKDFRRLCILKGIYPHEPKHKKKVNKGSTENKTFYYIKDIQFLAHEPIIDKFREYKVFLRQLKKAKHKHERESLGRLIDNRPRYKLDHIIKERYPTVEDAVNDLDDALTMCFLFARMPANSKVKSPVVNLCRRPSLEFLHYIIEARAIRKTFISIKGIYFQADIRGKTVTWIVPHERGQAGPSDVDFSVMSTFLQLYTVMMGFLNFALYQSVGLHYPPQLLEKGESKEKLEEATCLAKKLVKTIKEEEDNQAELDNFENQMEESDEKNMVEAKRIRRLPTLFKGMKFGLNRECPKEVLILLIRSCGGEIVWDFDGKGSKITHFILDRPKFEKKDLNVIYIQPQWVFDCINMGLRLPEADYFHNAVLPPHLSPFVDEQPGDYVPPERIRQMKMQGIDTSELVNAAAGDGLEQPALKRPKLLKDPKPEKNEDTDENEDNTNAVQASSNNSDSKNTTKQQSKNNKKSETSAKTVENDSAAGKRRMAVKQGQTAPKPHPQKLKNALGEERKLQEASIAKRHKRVYQKIQRGIKKKSLHLVKINY